MPGKFKLPTNHKPAMRVPKGGSSCANCTYYGPSEGTPHGICGSPEYVQYYGSPEIPYPPDEFCSDWYEPDSDSDD